MIASTLDHEPAGVRRAPFFLAPIFVFPVTGQNPYPRIVDVKELSVRGQLNQMSVDGENGVRHRLPGRRGALLLPTPQRTQRKTFALLRSGLNNAVCTTRLIDFQSQGVRLTVAGWVKQHTIIHSITTAF